MITFGWDRWLFSACREVTGQSICQEKHYLTGNILSGIPLPSDGFIQLQELAKNNVRRRAVATVFRRATGLLLFEPIRHGLNFGPPRSDLGT